MTEKHPAGHIALSVAYIIFGLNVPVMKSVLTDGEISPVALTFYRIGGAAFLFWTASLFTRKEKVVRRDLLLLFGASMAGIFFNQLLYVIGLSGTSPIDASVIVTVAPILTMLLAAFFLKEPITWQKAIGVFIGASGALLLIFNNNMDRGGASLTGNLLCILSTLSFVIYLTAFKNLILRYSPVTLMKWMYLFAFICSLPFCLHDVSAVDYGAFSLKTWLEILYIVGLATFFCYLMIPIGQKLLRPTIVSMYNYVQPVVSSLVAIAIGMDVFGWKKGLATILVFAGVYVVTHSKSRAQLEVERKEKVDKLTS
ncbi:MAG: DMT family transporter [Dysgonamonadaceae bacterium]|jgi:drug/metabolite transporter (DMT)-like permease|nr:DMT family transporter [Dysgonamonadaceae bacterium]